ncbi:hypothetical protein KUH03_30810 [Sphingobacterium sp. E70]|uniref:hypothetical protein n=1 Tax=Sphingobacterium sp. E70 TaxID=2853439 RepID=UPI00211D0E67|nr:hypothetical protein [Sphingobacterium sp. E70]ULT23528.1 hypothetical protein KUH03_30810 [Sphingobacterium sp. E70]
MIEAMAMFLAKRAKQEAAIWFMDELRKRVQNPLIQDVFPNTISMLGNPENYRTATFGTSWRYAISKDFVNLPKNIINSSWTTQYLSIEQTDDLNTCVSFAYDLQRLMMERYNYKDIIRYFYLNPAYRADSLSKSTVQSDIQNAFSVLYIATNELFRLQISTEQIALDCSPTKK